MRLIDAEPIEQALFKQADKSLAKNPYANARVCAFRRAFELVMDAPTIESLPSGAPPNDPLTIEELREMDGEPVWITPGGFWALVIANSGERVRLICNDGERVFADKEIELVGPVYRRRPKEGTI